MASARIQSLVLLITALIISGCETGAPARTVAEYRPWAGPVETPAPYTDVYLLWRWVPEKTKVAWTPGSAPPKQHPVQVWMSYASRGSPVGFRKTDGKLIAIAGETTQMLEDAHYTWETLPGETQHMDVERPVVAAYSDAGDSSAENPFLDFLSDCLDQIFSGGDDDSGGGGRGRGHADHGGRRHHDNSKSSHDPSPPHRPTSQPSPG